ncbi:MAG TPA: hypothetical protein VGO29_00630 [Solirubrobacteraceae bacterium]|nr:hypothetical protein [Solirubrobacteraceae bacterium]
MSTHSQPVPQPSKRRRIRPLLALCVLGACVALAACGSSGSGSTSAANTSSTSSTNKAAGQGAGRFTALRSCLQKQGITLPAPPSGGGRPPGAAGAAGPGARRGLQPPAGVSQSQFEGALKKCGAGNRPPGGGLNSASARAGLVKYAACLRQNGVNVPEPNTTGKGPVFNTAGIDTTSSKFKSAQSKCQSDLKGAFPGGGGAGAPPAGSPPAGEGTAG